MVSRSKGNVLSPLKLATRPLKRWRKDEQGFTAVEFGMVALPFLMLLFGIIEIGLLYFTTFSLENATEQAARLIRTGQAKTGNVDKAAFKTEVCNRVAVFADCTGKLRVDVQSFPNFAGIAPPNGLAGGNLVTDGSTQYGIGNGGDVVLVTAFYQWDMTSIIPFLNLSNMNGNARLIQASAVFRNEPF
jgi:Flp pilus assembly protein TadG